MLLPLSTILFFLRAEEANRKNKMVERGRKKMKRRIKRLRVREVSLDVADGNNTIGIAVEGEVLPSDFVRGILNW